MKKTKPLHTSYSTNNIDAVKLSQKISQLLENINLGGVYGMLSSAEEKGDGLLFYKRWKLEPLEKHHYNVVDTYTKNVIYEHVSLLTSAFHIIYYLNKPIKTICPKDQLIYALDQQYFRCLENIRIFKKKISSKDNDKSKLFLARLDDSYYRLDEIKTQLSKLY